MRTCEETVGYDQDNDLYIRCGQPAQFLVKHVGRNEGPYWMCHGCGMHNIKNRGGQDITPLADRRKNVTSVQVGCGHPYMVYEGDLPEVYALLSQLEKRLS